MDVAIKWPIKTFCYILCLAHPSPFTSPEDGKNTETHSQMCTPTTHTQRVGGGRGRKRGKGRRKREKETESLSSVLNEISPSNLLLSKLCKRRQYNFKSKTTRKTPRILDITECHTYMELTETVALCIRQAWV